MGGQLRKAEVPANLRTIEAETDFYREWQAREGVKVVVDYKFDNLKTLELGPWERKGGLGSIINIPNPYLPNDAHVIEISPGATSEPEHHLYEEIVYVLAGRGVTQVWLDGGEKRTLEWREGSLFTIPLNAWYQHFNGSGVQAVRYLAVTNAPPVMRLWRNHSFVLDNPFMFDDRFRPGEQSYFSGEGELFRDEGKVFSTIWRTNFVPDVSTMELWEYGARGGGGINTHFALDYNVTQAHVSEFPVGTYKKGHRHGPGAHLLILAGVGFSLLWWEGSEEKVKVDWRQGTLVVVPADDTYHQHFNTGTEPARYLALRPGDGTPKGGSRVNVSEKEGGTQIEYEDEDRHIHELFESELAGHGARCLMGSFVPWCQGGH